MSLLKHLAIDLTPLRVSRDYRLLFFGQLISFFGSMMTIIAVPWQIFELTKSSQMVGFLYLAEFVPMFILAFVGGALADAFDKRKLLQITEIGQSIATAILLINSFLPKPYISVLFVAVAFHAGFAALQRPAFESLIQQIIPKELMTSVMALNAIRWSLGAIISLALGGIIATQFSSATVYTIDLITFIATIIAVFSINAVASPKNPDRPSVRNVIQGWKYAFKRQDLVGTYLIDVAAMFFAMPQALYPALAVYYGEKFVGFFPAAIALGALLASLTSGWTKSINKHGLLIVLAAIGWGISITFFGLTSNFLVALFFLILAGYSDMISGIFRGAIWNQTIPNHLRGRLASIEMISYLTGPMLGSAKMGIVAEKFTPKIAIVSGGIISVFAVIFIALFLPKFLRYDGRKGIKRKELEEQERDELNKQKAITET